MGKNLRLAQDRDRCKEPYSEITASGAAGKLTDLFVFPQTSIIFDAPSEQGE